MYEIPTLVGDLLDRLKVNLTIHDLYRETKMAAELMAEDDHMSEDASMFDKDRRMVDGEDDRSLDDEVERLSLSRLTMTSGDGRGLRGHLGKMVDVTGHDEDMTPKSTSTRRSRSPYGGCDWIMMLEAEPNLVGAPVFVGSATSSWVSEPKPFGKPERFTGDEKRWTQWRFGMKA